MSNMRPVHNHDGGKNAYMRCMSISNAQITIIVDVHKAHITIRVEVHFCNTCCFCSMRSIVYQDMFTNVGYFSNELPSWKRVNNLNVGNSGHILYFVDFSSNSFSNGNSNRKSNSDSIYKHNKIKIPLDKIF